MKFAVLGCGNMASALVINMQKASADLSFATYTPSFLRAEKLAQKIHGIAYKNLKELPFHQMDVILLGCKPQQLPLLVKSLEEEGIDLKNKIIISMLAATSIATLATYFDSPNIIRIMPNTPIEHALGITLYFTKKTLPQEISMALAFGSQLFQCQSEDHLDQLMAITGSGPAYLFYFANTLAQKLQALGENEQAARSLVNQLFLGTAKLMNATDMGLTDLISQVTSKAGVTIEAIKYFEQAQLTSIISDAIDQAISRSKQITQEMLHNFPK
jgi:pyrroline-5-carboxylate reductase